MSQGQIDQIRLVNSQVNAATPYDGSTGPTEPVDFWTDTPIPGYSFVCRDYVLAKSKALGAEGWTSDELSVVLCWTEPVYPPPNDRAYHAVLAAKVDGEIWILDSRQTDIYLWNTPPADYEWDRQQIAGTTEFQDVSATGLA